MMTPRPIHCEPCFLPLLEEFGFDQLEKGGATIYGLWPDLRLAYANPAWSRFAAENGGQAILKDWTIGRCVIDAIAEPLRPFFVDNYAQCLEQSRPWEHTYECSSDKLYREYHMTAFPLGRREGLLVIHSLRIEAASTRIDAPPLEERYRNAEGMICQCCHCRRIRRVGDEANWDWVAAWVNVIPPGTSHGICPECFGFHYSKSRAAEAGFAQPLSTIVARDGTTSHGN